MLPRDDLIHDSHSVTLDSLDAVFDAYFERMYQYMHRRVGNREDAEDLTSEVFVRASGQLDLQRSDWSIASWLFTVARTVLMDYWRRYYRQGPALPLDELRDPSARQESPSAADSSDPDKRVAAILAALPPRYRRVLELRFLHGCSLHETAQEMGVTFGNVKVLQHRALAKAATLSGLGPEPMGPRPSIDDTDRHESERLMMAS